MKKRLENIINFITLALARIILSTLAIAGMVHLLGGVDPIIVYPVSIAFVAFLLKETL